MELPPKQAVNKDTCAGGVLGNHGGLCSTTYAEIQIHHEKNVQRHIHERRENEKEKGRHGISHSP